jgi:hypothetical protein
MVGLDPADEWQQPIALAFDEAIHVRLLVHEGERAAQAEALRRSGGHGIPPDMRYETAADLVH